MHNITSRIDMFNQIFKISETFMMVYKIHIEDNDEIIEHLLMAEYVRYIELLLEDSRNETLILTFFDVLENSLRENTKELEELIYVSFIELISIKMQKFILTSKYTSLKSELNTYLNFQNNK